MSKILAIDIGNTNVVIGYISDGNVIITDRIATDCSRSSEDYYADITEILAIGKIAVTDIEGSIISSVVPQLTDRLKNAAEQVTKTTALIVNSEFRTGLNLLVDNPKKLGSDRVVDAAAAVHYYGGPIIIIDMGTATTVSAVDENSNFLGGMIMLGVKGALEALSSKTAQLPHINLEGCKELIGKNTIECMQSGSIYGHAAMVDGIILRLQKQIGENAAVVATGGLARVIIPYCEEKIIYDEHLLLKGLYFLYSQNCS
jgi:type III pantothenate kinase